MPALPAIQRPEISIRETAVETVFLVNPADANPLGILHGGNMMNWLVSVGTLAVSRMAKGNAVLGSLDSVFFVNPVRVGNLAYVRAWIEYIGKSSLEVGVRARTEDPITGQTSVTTLSHMAFIAVGMHGEPRLVPARIKPEKGESAIYRQAVSRWEARKSSLRGRKLLAEDTGEYGKGSKWHMSFSRIVMTEDAVYGGIMFGGRLLKLLDEFTGALATRFCKGAAVTGAVDDMSFYYPIRVGDVLDVDVALNRVGRSSLEIGAKVVAEDPFTGNRHHAATAYYTFVHIGSDGKPVSVPPYIPRSKDEIMRLEEAESRADQREKKLIALRELVNTESPGRFADPA
jgi:acyl-CoA hydrolase